MVPPTPIDNLFEQLKSCMKFTTEGRDPITSITFIRIGALIIEEKGIFPIISKEWRAKAAPQRMLAAFKTHFRQADKEYRRKATTAKSGYHTANAAYQPEPIPIKQDMELLTLLNTLFTTTPSAFVAAVTETSTVISQVTNHVTTFTPANFTTTVIAAISVASGSNNNNRNCNRNRTNNNAIPAGYGYCWSHGPILNVVPIRTTPQPAAIKSQGTNPKQLLKTNWGEDTRVEI